MAVAKNVEEVAGMVESTTTITVAQVVFDCCYLFQYRYSDHSFPIRIPLRQAHVSITITAASYCHCS